MQIGNDGLPNQGGGGGGGGATNSVNSNGCNGGSGIVIIAYPDSFNPISIDVGLTYILDTVSRPGYKVYKFTAGTGNITF
jgi:hypothetical protein